MRRLMGLGLAVALAALSPRVAVASPSPGGQACAFIFYGAVGEGGEYLERFRAAFRNAGVQAVIPNYGWPWSVDGLRRLVGEAGSVTGRNDLAYARTLAGDAGMQAAARQSRAGGGYSLAGYSNGAVMAAAQAWAIAENGGVVNRLVLVGAPINIDLYDAVRRHRNIGRVTTVDLRGEGDPIRSGMSDASVRLALPRLAWQFPPKTGHFVLSGTTARADRAREDLARLIVREGWC